MEIDANFAMLGRRPTHYATYSIGVMKSGLVHALSVNTFSEGPILLSYTFSSD